MPKEIPTSPNNQMKMALSMLKVSSASTPLLMGALMISKHVLANISSRLFTSAFDKFGAISSPCTLEALDVSIFRLRSTQCTIDSPGNLLTGSTIRSPTISPKMFPQCGHIEKTGASGRFILLLPFYSAFVVF